MPNRTDEMPSYSGVFEGIIFNIPSDLEPSKHAEYYELYGRLLFYRLMDPMQHSLVQELLFKNLKHSQEARLQQIGEDIPIYFLDDDVLFCGLFSSIINHSVLAAEQLLCLLYVGTRTEDPTLIFEQELRFSHPLTNFINCLASTQIPNEVNEIMNKFGISEFSDYLICSFLGLDFVTRSDIKEFCTTLPSELKSNFVESIKLVATRFISDRFKFPYNAYKHGTRTKLINISNDSIRNLGLNEAELFLARTSCKLNDNTEFGMSSCHFDIEFEVKFCRFCCELSNSIVTFRREYLSGKSEPSASFKVFSETDRKSYGTKFDLSIYKLRSNVSKKK